MTKIQQMMSSGIPVIENLSNEATGEYAFLAMTEEQQRKLAMILGGYPVSISIDSNIIIGDGVDEILLIVQGEPETLTTIDVLTGNTPSTVNVQLDENGNGSQVFSCETSPTVIVFSNGDTSVKVRAL